MADTKPALEMRYVTGIINKVCDTYGFVSSGSPDTFQKQIDGDNISVEADAILVVNETLERLGLENFAIYFSHSDVLDGILETVRVPEPLRPQIFPAIRGFSKFNIEGFVNELQKAGVSENATNILADLFLKTDEILNQEHDVNQTVVSNLLNIVNTETLTGLGQILRSTGRKPVLIDPALPCEPPYGPGIVIEARTSGLDILGEGGCVDENFVFTFDIENIVELMNSEKN